MNDQLGIDDLDIEDFENEAIDDQIIIREQSAAKAASSSKKIEATLDNFKPTTKKDMDKLSDLFVDKMYEFHSNKFFNYFLEQTSLKMGQRQETDNYESVKLMGSKLSNVGNNKQQEYKRKTKGKKKVNKGVQLGRGGGDLENLDEYADFDDDFM